MAEEFSHLERKDTYAPPGTKGGTCTPKWIKDNFPLRPAPAVTVIPLLLLVLAFITVTLVMNGLTYDTAVESQNVICPAGMLEPPLAGVMPGAARPKIVLAADVDYPPYTYVGAPPEANYAMAGFAVEFAREMGPQCGIDVHVGQTDWEDCWTGTKIGKALKEGAFHGCLSYTHTPGARSRFMEFSHAIVRPDKPAGLLTRLDPVTGVPVVDGGSDLNGKKVVDVSGWAPTPDGLGLSVNTCTGKNFRGFEILTPASTGNDAAMRMLMDGTADAMWVNADQAHLYNCSNLAPGVSATWDCALWDGFGTKYAYIHVGVMGYAENGTTLVASKVGSGVREMVNPCMQKYMESKAYLRLCEKHGLLKSCYRNSFFNATGNDTAPWQVETINVKSSCSSGYCQCPPCDSLLSCCVQVLKDASGSPVSVDRVDSEITLMLNGTLPPTWATEPEYASDSKVAIGKLLRAEALDAASSVLYVDVNLYKFSATGR